jgi:hypothetical protein
MGACSIEERGSGTSMADVYTKLVNQAVYDYGHDPYSGTIATTNGFFDKTARFNEILKQNDGDSDKAFEIFADEAFDNTQKWGPVWGVNCGNYYQFYGWAAK